MNNIEIKKQLLKLGLITLGLNSLGCAKNVECNVSDEHVHIYIDEDKNLEKYILGEKDHKGVFIRTDDYEKLNDELKVVCDNNLLLVSDNIGYITKTMGEYIPYRETYAYDYRYSYNFTTNSYDYHWSFDWDKIDMNKYTKDKVRDITYNYKLYKINKGTNKIEYDYFDSLEEAPAEYKYFKVSDLINKNTSESYYLEKNKTYNNVK